MMKRLRTHNALQRIFIAGLCAAILLLPLYEARAIIEAEGGGIAESQSGYSSPGSGCAWENMMGAFSMRESTNNPQARNPRLGYAGLFQFGEAAMSQIGWYCSKPVCSQCWQGFKGQFCQKARDHGVNSIEDFMNNPDAQKVAFKDWMTYMYEATKKCHNKIGQQAPNGKCTVTLSGILGGGHLGGAGGVCKYLNSGYDPNDGDTAISAYVCCFKGYAPCSAVAPGDPSCNDSPSPDGVCGDPDQKNCEAGKAMSDGAGSKNPDYEDGPTESGEDLDGGPSEHHLNALSETLKSIWVATLQLMTNQLTTAMINQVQSIGMLFDAKQQLENQRLLQQKTAEAHKDYHPSKQVCEVGTLVRNLASTEKYMEMTHLAVARRILKRELSAGDASTVEGDKSDMKSRMKHIREVYCNVEDNGNDADYICNDKDADPVDVNRDVDYTTTIDSPMSLQIDIDDGTLSRDEENVFALMNNLFHHRPFPAIPESYTTLKRFTEPFQEMRSVIAIRGLARNSIAAIVAEKTEGPDHEGNAAPFMRALIKDFGLAEDEILKLLGERPSYYAQMDILTKKLYQHPNFIVSLYDKPANVTRIRTSMRAIKSMQDQDIHEALMRREMLISMILEIRIRQRQAEMLTDIRNNLYRTSTGPRL